MVRFLDKIWHLLNKKWRDYGTTRRNMEKGIGDT